MNDRRTSRPTNTYVPLEYLWYNPSRDNHEQQRQQTSVHHHYDGGYSSNASRDNEQQRQTSHYHNVHHHPHNRRAYDDGQTPSSSSSLPSSSSRKRARPHEHDRHVIVPGSPDRDGPVLDEHLMTPSDNNKKRSKNKGGSSIMDRPNRCSSSSSDITTENRGHHSPSVHKREHKRPEKKEVANVKTESMKKSKLKVYSEKKPSRELRQRFDFCSEIKMGEAVAVFVLPAPMRTIMQSNEQQQQHQSQQTLSLPHLSLTMSALHALADLNCSIVTHRWLRACEATSNNDDVALAQYAPDEKMNISLDLDLGFKDCIGIDFKEVMEQRQLLIQSGESLFTGVSFHFSGLLSFNGINHIKCAVERAGATVRTKPEMDTNLGPVTIYVITLRNHPNLERFSLNDYNLQFGTEVKLIDVRFIVLCLLRQKRLDASGYVIPQRKYPPLQHGCQQQQQVSEQGESLDSTYRIPKLSESLHRANRQEQQRQQQQYGQQSQWRQQTVSSDKTRIPKLPKRLQVSIEKQQQIQQQSRQRQTEEQQMQQRIQQQYPHQYSKQQQLPYLPQHPQTQQLMAESSRLHVSQTAQLPSQQYLPNEIDWILEIDNGGDGGDVYHLSTPFDIDYTSLLRKSHNKLNLTPRNEHIRKIKCKYIDESRKFLVVDDNESLRFVKDKASRNAQRNRLTGPLTLEVKIYIKQSSRK